MPIKLTEEQILAKGYYYHVTPSENRQSIDTDGLQVSFKDGSKDGLTEPQIHLYSVESIKAGLEVASSKILSGSLSVIRVASSSLSELAILLDEEDAETVRLMESLSDPAEMVRAGAAIACFDDIPPTALEFTGEFDTAHKLELIRGNYDTTQYE